MSSEGKKLGIGVFCVDWRLHQKAVRLPERVAEALGVDAIDVVAVPGPDGLLQEGGEGERDALTKWLKLLIDAHHPAAIAIVAHYSCAGYPAEDSEHDVAVKKAAEYYKHATGFAGDVRAFSAVRENDEKWELKEIARL